MMRAGMGEHARPMLYRPALRVIGAEHQFADTEGGNGAGTQHAGLHRHRQRAIRKILAAAHRPGLGQHQHLGMRRRVLFLLDIVAGCRKNHAIVIAQHGAYGNLASFGSFAGEFEGGYHRRDHGR